MAVWKNPNQAINIKIKIPIKPLIINIFAIVLDERSFKNIPNIPKNTENSIPTIHIFKNKSTWVKSSWLFIWISVKIRAETNRQTIRVGIAKINITNARNIRADWNIKKNMFLIIFLISLKKRIILFGFTSL